MPATWGLAGTGREPITMAGWGFLAAFTANAGRIFVDVLSDNRSLSPSSDDVERFPVIDNRGLGVS